MCTPSTFRLNGILMREVSVKQLREQLADYITAASDGEEVVITRRGKPVARLVPPTGEGVEFPDLSEFRSSIALEGEPLSETVIDERRQARY